MATQDMAEGPLRFEGQVVAALPLALLEAVRAHDRPGEVLEDEDLMLSLPRRLGLTGVVHTQIRRYEEAQRTRRPVPLEDVINLMRLVLRRPDAGAILRQTGERLAQSRLGDAPGGWSRLLRRAPLLSYYYARRAARRLLRDVHAGAGIDMAKPLTVRVPESMTARFDPTGTACALITGLLEEVARRYTGRPQEVVHARCTTTGNAVCEWRVT